MSLAKVPCVDHVPCNHDHGVAVAGRWRALVILPDGVAFRCRHGVTWRAWMGGGFTLHEVLIAMVLLSIGFLGLSAMTIGTIRGMSHSENLTTATALARERLAHIAHADYGDVIAANYPPDNYNTMAGYEQFQRTVTITDETPEPDTKTIAVTVSWRNHAGVTRTITLRTVISL